MSQERKKIKLDPALPCSIFSPNTLNMRCNKPATVAHADPYEPSEYDQWPVFGLWLIQPICEECAAKMLQVYE